MTSYVTPKKNAAYILYVGLEDQSNKGLFKASPTLAAGDFKVSIDGGTLNNLATLPTNTPSSSKMVKISLSADEMNGDNITVVCSDASGAEWFDLVINLQTTANQVDDLATATALNAVDDYVDTEVAAIKAKTDYLPSIAAGAAGGLPVLDANLASAANVTHLAGESLSGNNATLSLKKLHIANSDIGGKAVEITANNSSGRAIYLSAWRALDAIGGGGGAVAFDGLVSLDNGVEIAGQVKITADVSSEGALHLDNIDPDGYGLYAGGGNTGLYAQGGTAGQYNNGGLLSDLTGDITGNLSGDVQGGVGGSITGNLIGKVLGSGPATISGIGVRAVDGSGDALATATALAAAKSILDKLDSGLELSGGVYRFTSAILAQVDAILSAAHGGGAWGGSAGSGALTFTYTVTNELTGLPVPDVAIEVYTDAAMTNLVAVGATDTFGQAVFYLDAGTYYFKRIKEGWQFTNPDVEVVA